jgi:2-isopropylmalate synthase
MKIQMYDTTLRDGAQGEGISFSVADKLKIARALDDFGVDFIEGGWPGSNPKDEEFFEIAKSLEWKNAKLAAFTMTRRANVRPEDDANLKTIIAARTPVVTVVGKSWDFHVERALRVPLDENLRMIEESVRYLKAQGIRVFFIAEHFFDALAQSPDYAMQTLQAAADGGAEMLALPDTNGGSMPHHIAHGVQIVRERFGLPVGIHTHNDCELAVANALAGVQAGATQVQGTINGFGERTGNCNLVSVIANLQLKMGYEAVPEASLPKLSYLSHFVSEVANLVQDDTLPFVGKSVFAHKGGMHVDAVQKAGGRAYEHIDPASVGNERRILVSELAGTSNVRSLAEGFGVELTKGSPEEKKILSEIKRLESHGYEFEGADASFQLLVRRTLGSQEKLFDLLGARVVNEWRRNAPASTYSGEESDWVTEATLKIKLSDAIVHVVAEGDGPVHALDNALRKALRQFYPEMDGIKLDDFKVRIVNTREGTAAKVRVLIESSDEAGSWSTVGVSTNIIEASWQALDEAIVYGLTQSASASK